MPALRVADADLHYAVHGEGAPLVFLHGSGGNHLSWWQQIPALARRFRCIVFDHRGYGRSGRVPAVTGETLLDDLRALLDHLQVGRSHLVGQSLGGRTALAFALSAPDRLAGLVLAGTVCGIADPAVTRSLAAAAPPPESLFERALSPGFRRDQPALAFLYRQIEALNLARGLPPPAFAPGPAAERLARLSVPALFVVGAEDPVAPPPAVAAAAALIPDARLEVVHGAGHSVYFEQPDAFNRLVAGFADEAAATVADSA